MTITIVLNKIVGEKIIEVEPYMERLKGSLAGIAELIGLPAAHQT